MAPGMRFRLIVEETPLRRALLPPRAADREREVLATDRGREDPGAVDLILRDAPGDPPVETPAADTADEAKQDPNP